MSQPLKTFLTEESLDFALAHIMSFYDTDFFPRTEEFLAIAHNWKEVKQHLLSSSLDQLLSASPVVEPWAKVRGGYRIVHRLEPIDSLIYTAMAKRVLGDVEKSRLSPEVACSYRFTQEWDSFFGEGTGFEVYRERCYALAEKYQFVLCADIADFYNKIYLHRLQNALQLACDEPKDISKKIESFITALNTKASQGIPIGPAASIVMSEATLTDVDKFVMEKGHEHVRYVDDFRIFGDTFSGLQVLLQSLTTYLHENHRLSLNSEKTFIVTGENFVDKELNNQYAQEKLQILGEIEGADPYSHDPDEEADAVPTADLPEVLVAALEKLIDRDTLDLGLARTIIRRAKAHTVPNIAPILLENLFFLAPVVNDVVLYLDALSAASLLSEFEGLLTAAVSDPAMDIRTVRLWFEWYFARRIELLSVGSIKAFVWSSERLRPQAQAAILLKNESWIKERKNKILHYAYWDRRSIILAASVLAKDERDKWLTPLMKNDGVSMLDRWMMKWVLDGSSANVDPFGFDDLPF